jgi:hypothetical protein
MDECAWYIVNCPLDMQEIFKENHISYSIHKITSPYCFRGICFPEYELDNVLKIFKTEDKSSLKITPTDRDNMCMLEIFENYVIIENERSSGRIREILELFSRTFKKKIYLHSSRDCYRESIDDGIMHIFPYCCPKISDFDYGEPEKKSVNKLFGFDINYSEISYLITTCKAEGIDIKDADGNVCAKICGEGKNNIFLFYDFDLSRSGRSVIYERFITKTLNIYFSQIASENLVRTMWKEHEKKLTEASREKYRETCHSRLNELEKQLEAEKSGCEQRIKEYSLNLTAEYRNLELIKEKIAVISVQDPEELDNLGREYDLLLSNENVERVWVREDSVDIFTKELILEGRLIGKFRISFSFKHDNFECRNTTSVIHGYDHPHICPDDYCLGENIDELFRLISRKQYSVAFHFLWRRLNIYSSSNPYCPIERWPLAKEARRG